MPGGQLNPRTHSSEHPASWYAASRVYPQTWPALSGSINTDICVIGGGFSGVNTALELAERGYRVVLLEAWRIGWGASGRNGGQLIRGVGHGLEPFRSQIGQEGIDTLRQMGLEAVEIVRERVARYAIDCDLTWGYCDVANTPSHLRDFEAEKRWLDAHGYRHETRLVPRAAMHTVVGSDRYLGGLVDMGSGHLHPLNLVTGEAVAAAALGVQIFEQSRVIDVVLGETCRVRTLQGEVHASRLVICGNAHVAGLHEALESRVLPAGSYVIATAPLDAATARRLLPQNMAISDQRIALDYYRLSADRRLLFGGLCTYSGRDPKDIVAPLRRHLIKVFPDLAEIPIDYAWGGMIGIGANRLPQIGRLRPNVYYAQAYSGHGLNATHLAARLIAESVHQESRRIEVFERVRHLRFPGGRRFRSPLLALGMLYHRLREVLGR